MSQPPIVPGPDEPYPPHLMYQPPQPYQPPPPAPAQPSDVVGKTALGTVVVVVTLFLLLCVAPMVFCVGCGAVGNLMG